MDENFELAPLRIIRRETALSRYPLHKLVKTKENFSIEIRRQNAYGEFAFQWKVSYNSDYGQPGPLAYKLDTLIINRRIEQAPRPIPSEIRLGSLREIAEEMGLGGDTSSLKKALHQNASAYITAKFKYTGKDGRERTAEFGKTRYGVIFTGQTLEDGRAADAVYIELHDWYRDLLNESQTRPLDYDYLKDLPPLAQRLYELLSFQMYATLRNNRSQARYLYSDFCTYAPATRYDNYEQVKKQMHKIHTPHKQAGYIASVEFQKTSDQNDRPDWMMVYTPGPKARAEYAAFTKRGRGEAMELFPLEGDEVAPPSQTSTTTSVLPARELSAGEQALVARLVALEVAEGTAQELVRSYAGVVAAQLDALPQRDLQGVRDRAAWLIAAIKENYSLPERVVQEKKRATHRQQEKARQAYEIARQRHEKAHSATYGQYLDERVSFIKTAHPEAYNAFETETAAERLKSLRVFGNRPDSPLAKIVVAGIVTEYFQNHPQCPILDFWQWDQAHNPTPFQQQPPDEERGKGGDEEREDQA